MTDVRGSRLFGAALGLGLDRLLGEPPTVVHPVAAFGRLMGGIERAVYRDEREAGIRYTAVGVAVAASAGVATGSTAVAVAATSAGRMLRTTARSIERSLRCGDLAAARAELPALVGRDPSTLDESGVAAAVIESLAENTVDAVVAPAIWGAAWGAPGAAAYRAVNTMDAMVGHKSPRYRSFGWASARLDDVANFAPARVTAALVCLASPGRVAAIRRAVRVDAPHHPSPNAGVAEAAFAAALGVEIGGTVRYGERVEERPRLGCGHRPTMRDIEPAARLADRVELLLAGGLVALGLLTFATRKSAA